MTAKSVLMRSQGLSPGHVPPQAPYPLATSLKGIKPGLANKNFI